MSIFIRKGVYDFKYEKTIFLIPYLYKTIVVWILVGQTVLFERFLNGKRRHILVGHQQCLVGYVGLQRLAIDLQCAAAVAILYELQLVLKLLLSSTRHHNLGIRYGAREVTVGHFFVQMFGHVDFVLL